MRVLMDPCPVNAPPAQADGNPSDPRNCLDVMRELPDDSIYILERPTKS